MAESLRRRLTLSFVVIALGSALLTAILINAAFGGRFDTYLGQQRSARASQLANAFTAAYEPDRGWQEDRLDRLAPLVAMSGAEVRLVDSSGESVWSLRDSQMGPEMAQMHRDMGSAGALSPQQRVSLMMGGRRIGDLYLTLPEGTVPLADREFRRSVNWLLLLGGLGAGSIGVGAGVIVSRRTVRPITELTSAARDLQAGDRHRRAAVAGNDEIAELARAFNDLVDSVEREDAVRRAFAADVAHELRTPLAVLRSQLEAVQDGVIEPAPGLFRSLHEETLRLGRLTADLETMTSADSVEFDLHRRPVDLADVVARAGAALSHRFAERQLRLILSAEPAVVSGDEVRLQQVVTNLLTNTLKFVPPGGSVRVSTRTVNGRAELDVHDDGPGISPDDLAHVFERFYRGHQVRTGGSGIGLAVVAALVHAHGGEVTVVNLPDGGAAFRIRLTSLGTDQAAIK
ncbi:MAG: HAMP domain-containing protein [Geodermatophilaceae bacterium]|nr:HAMP domain-containing protein [Geodermatophilaceae bacterium]